MTKSTTAPLLSAFVKRRWFGGWKWISAGDARPAIDWGTLGHAELFRFRTTAGVVFHGIETYAGYEQRGASVKTAEARAWATVNKLSGGGNRSGSGRKNHKLK